MKELIVKQDKYNQKLSRKIYSEMENFRKNPSNGNRYFEEIMVEIDNQRDIVRKETVEYVADKMIRKLEKLKESEKSGTQKCG